METIRVLHFSDLLCVWAYIAQVRIDQLLQTFPEKLSIDYHSCQVFGNVPAKMDKGWSHRGGIEGYRDHVLATAKRFDHIEVHPNVWATNTPQSSMSCHLFASAVQQLAERQEHVGKEQYPELLWALRLAFFRDAKDIACWDVQAEVAEEMGLPVGKIQEQIRNGQAYACLANDLELASTYNIKTSPTLVFNEGRQRLLGNVGYRVIEANVRELLHKEAEEFSWC
ncbi:MAG: disulfide bond formation protein DsbA [Deltaproteobacteria bacterium]|nr:MAG: disulfide bond formation protein DsbA [Deltaproteobacteria bacterium]